MSKDRISGLARYALSHHCSSSSLGSLKDGVLEAGFVTDRHRFVRLNHCQTNTIQRADMMTRQEREV